MYKPITEEQEKQIQDLIGTGKLSTRTTKEGYYLTITSMYSYVSFGNLSVLSAYLKIAEILNCKEGDEVDRTHYSGCPTCDYGSSYILELKFW